MYNRANNHTTEQNKTYNQTRIDNNVSVPWYIENVIHSMKELSRGEFITQLYIQWANSRDEVVKQEIMEFINKLTIDNIYNHNVLWHSLKGYIEKVRDWDFQKNN